MSQKPYNETKKYKFWEKKWAKFKLKHSKAQSLFDPGDLVTCTGEREISVVSARLLDNPGELVYMKCSFEEGDFG